MDIERISGGCCPIAHAVSRVGDAWSMMILRDAGAGAVRFEQLRASLGIAPNILARRLAALTANGCSQSGATARARRATNTC